MITRSHRRLPEKEIRLKWLSFIFSKFCLINNNCIGKAVIVGEIISWNLLWLHTVQFLFSSFHQWANIICPSFILLKVLPNNMILFRYSRFMDMETDTNPIDRSIAHLLFHPPSDSSIVPPHDGSSLNSQTVVSFFYCCQLMLDDLSTIC